MSFMYKIPMIWYHDRIVYLDTSARIQDSMYFVLKIDSIFWVMAFKQFTVEFGFLCLTKYLVLRYRGVLYIYIYIYIHSLGMLSFAVETYLCQYTYWQIIRTSAWPCNYQSIDTFGNADILKCNFVSFVKEKSLLSYTLVKDGCTPVMSLVWGRRVLLWCQHKVSL